MKKLKWMALIAVGWLCGTCNLASPERCVKGDIIAYIPSTSSMLVSLDSDFQNIGINGYLKTTKGEKKCHNVVLLINPEILDTNMFENFRNKKFNEYDGKKIEIKLRLATEDELNREGGSGFLVNENSAYSDLLNKVKPASIITEVCSKIK